MLPEELRKTYNYELPIRKAEMFGAQYDSVHRKLKAYKINSNALYLISLTEGYLKSYQNAQDYTALHYRDLLLYQAITELLRNLQYTDSTHSTLTNHASYFWNNYTYFDVWNTDIKYPLGTLASWYSSDGGLATDIIEQSLSNYWSAIGISANLNPYDKLQAAKSSIFIYDYSTLLDDIRVYINGPMGYRSLISEDDFGALTSKLLLGTYSTTVIDFCKHIYNTYRLDSVRNYLDTVSLISAFAKPVGFISVYQALAVEGYLKAAQIIQSNPSIYLVPFETYMSQASSSLFSYILQATTAYDVVNSTSSSSKILSLYSKYKRNIDPNYLVNV